MVSNLGEAAIPCLFCHARSAQDSVCRRWAKRSGSPETVGSLDTTHGPIVSVHKYLVMDMHSKYLRNPTTLARDRLVRCQVLSMWRLQTHPAPCSTYGGVILSCILLHGTGWSNKWSRLVYQLIECIAPADSASFRLHVGGETKTKQKQNKKCTIPFVPQATSGLIAKLVGGGVVSLLRRSVSRVFPACL